LCVVFLCLFFRCVFCAWLWGVWVVMFGLFGCVVLGVGGWGVCWLINDLSIFNYSCMEIIHIKNNRPYAYKYNQYIEGSMFIMMRQMEGET
ncbi:hypothetical protein PV939_12095, partial [Ligilactobacillus salivarius]|nr:hypothetical protein [Ligilactobacillus salivarius]